MAGVAVGRRRRWSPPPTARVNWSHPLTAQLDSLVIPQNGSVRDLVTMTAPDLVSPSLVDEPSPRSMGWMQDFDSAGVFWSVTAKPTVAVPFSAFVWIVHGNAAAVGWVSYGGSGPGNGWMLGTNTGAQMRLLFGNVAVYNFSAGSLPAAVTEITAAVSVAGSTAAGYVNGMHVGSVSVGAMATPSSRGLGIGAGANASSTVNPHSRPVGLVAVWKRAISSAEVASLDADPFQMLRF